MLGRGVDDGGDLAADERVGAHAVDVDVVDDGDVAGAQSLGQVLRAAVQPGGAGDSGPRLLGPAAPKGADAHDPHGFTRRWTPGPPTRNGDLSVTHRVRHHGRCDTPGPPPPVVARDRYLLVTSVAGVTGVAHALPRTDPRTRADVRRGDRAGRADRGPPAAIRRGHPRGAAPPSRNRPAPARAAGADAGRPPAAAGPSADPGAGSCAGRRPGRASSTPRPNCSPSAGSTRSA